MERKKKNVFKGYGFLGIFLILLAETGIYINTNSINILPFLAYKLSVWATPVCWWGYILIVDALIYRIKGSSLLTVRSRDFILQMFLSVIFWLLFEIYNLHMDNWKYIGWPKNNIELAFGLVISFATIMPAMFLTAELLECTGIFKNLKISKLNITGRFLNRMILMGFIFVIAPLLLKRDIARYLFILVWTGYIFLLEPVNYSSGGNSLLRDLENGYLPKIACLFVSGYICGFLWEFWNYWSISKWVYTAPFTSNVKCFEMPVAGFLGFGPFAWEFFIMYNSVKILFRKRKPGTGFQKHLFN